MIPIYLAVSETVKTVAVAAATAFATALGTKTAEALVEEARKRCTEPSGDVKP